MNVELLSRIQFALTAGFHFFYPPISIGLGVILVIMEGMYLYTKQDIYQKMTKFWVKIFSLVFAMGVATGIVLEFEFGTNWSRYSRFVGDVFGSALAAEAIFAFFLESGFLAILIFGWNKVSPKVHFLSTIMVSFGSILSAVWIITANSWMQTPTSYHVVTNSQGLTRAEILDFWAMVFNPSTIDRLQHTILASFMIGSFFVTSVSAYYLLKNKHIEFAKKSIKIALTFALVSSLLQVLSGHSSAKVVAFHQPTKLAAMEAHYDSLASAKLYLFGWVNDANKEVKFGVAIPGMLSWLIYGDANAKVKGLNAYKPEDLPPVNFVFQSYHIMVALGFLIILIAMIGAYKSYKDTILNSPAFLKILVFSVLIPQIATQFGWIVAEVGRQPWIVYNLLRTKDAFSPMLSNSQVIFSLILFTAIYFGIFILFISILNKKIKDGPEVFSENSNQDPKINLINQ